MVRAIDAQCMKEEVTGVGLALTRSRFYAEGEMSWWSTIFGPNGVDSPRLRLADELAPVKCLRCLLHQTAFCS